MKRSLPVILAIGCLIGCGGATSDSSAATSVDRTHKGPEDNAPGADGKADLFFAPTEHGTLSFAELNDATIKDHALFHAWDFTLSDDATVILTTHTTKVLDTVAYLYRRDPGTSSWGHYIAKNDDYMRTVESRVAKDLPAGEYRLLVKPYKSEARGSFSVSGECRGTGCPTEAQQSQSQPPYTTERLLSDEERQATLKAIEDICGDTFCAGDLNYHMEGLSCDGWGQCVLKYRGQMYGEPSSFTAETLTAHTDAERTSDGDIANGSYIGHLDEVQTLDDGNWMYMHCQLDGGYLTEESVVGDPLLPSYNEQFFSDFMECVSGNEALLRDWAASASR